MTEAPSTTEPALGEPQGRPVGPFAFGAGIVLVSGVLLSQVFAIETDEGLAPQGPRFMPFVVITLKLPLRLVHHAQQASSERGDSSV